MEGKYLVVYQRGFIGVNTPGLNVETNDKAVINKIIDLRYNNIIDDKDSAEVYNLNITKIYKTLNEGILSNDRLTIIKAIVSEAVRTFGTNDFDDWVDLQKKSRYFSKHHQSFIIDTIRFIKTGKRETSIRTWQIAVKKELTNSHTHVSNNPGFNKEIQDFYRYPAIDGKPISVELNRIITQWLSWRDGYIDLINTLNILFGRLN